MTEEAPPDDSWYFVERSGDITGTDGEVTVSLDEYISINVVSKKRKVCPGSGLLK